MAEKKQKWSIEGAVSTIAENHAVGGMMDMSFGPGNYDVMESARKFLRSKMSEVKIEKLILIKTNMARGRRDLI